MLTKKQRFLFGLFMERYDAKKVFETFEKIRIDRKIWHILNLQEITGTVPSGK